MEISQWSGAGNTLHQPKDKRGKSKYNVIVRSFFCWIDPLFWLGCRRSLEFTDLYLHPSEADSQYILTKFNKYWSIELERRKNGHSPRLYLVWLKCFWWRLLLQAVLYFLEAAILISQSQILGLLADYFIIENPSEQDTFTAYLYAMGLSLSAFTLTLVHAANFYISHKLGMLTRILMSSIIYQKVISLSQIVIGKLTVGHIVNLISNDVHKFEQVFLFAQVVWIGPINVAVVTYLLYREVQWSAFIATGLIVAQLPVQLLLVYFFSKFRLKAARMTDNRIKIMNEVISGIRVIKMYAWEYAFRDVVTAVRKSEVFMIIKYYMMRSASLAYDAVASPLVMFIMFSVYISTSSAELQARNVFVSLSLILFLRFQTVFAFFLFTLNGSDARVAWNRIKNFILLDELLLESSKTNKLTADGDIALHSLSSENNITVHDMSASWSMDNDKLTLQNISFSLNNKSLMAVVGSVGCGKSTLLQCLLNELPALSGTVQVNGSIGYASQEAWVFSASLRENILFGLPYDSERYNTVIEACALDKDIKALPNGDMTLVGERGVTLSGGQKARVNLARAVYRQADIYLLDDPLSAVDAGVGRHIFDKCICGLLSEKCVILVTHQIQYLKQCDIILGLREGSIAVYGDPTDILKDESNIFELLNISDDTKTDESKNIYAIRKHSISVNQNSVEEIQQNVSKFQNTLSDINEDELHTTLTDALDFQYDTVSLHSDFDTSDKSDEVVGMPVEQRDHGRISIKTYYQYLTSGHCGHIFTAIVALMFIITESNTVTSDWWISDWADCESESNLTRPTCNLSNTQRIGVYSGIIGSLIIFGVLRVVLFILLMLNSSTAVHNKMFSKILRSPILFFDTNPIGRVLNRFSKDVGFLDDRLIQVFYTYLILLIRFLAIMITACIANPYMLIVVAALCIGSMLFRWYYIKTARDLKRLEALARSPLYSHISLTIQGLPTIRSYCMENEALNEFHTLQNQHTQAAYLYLVAVRWFGMRIDMISSLFVTIVAFISIPLSSNLNAGLVGLSLTYAISLNGLFQFCIRESAEVESLMVSAQRVMAYGKLDTEASLESDPSVKPETNWPSKGQIDINDLSYRHSTNGPLVLKGISCNIKSGENIGIVGRTGAGKSSLIAALFRLSEPCGCIKIDGVDVSQIGLHDLRSKISIIPQDPVLFGGTVRYNLDPFNQYDDAKIWTALKQVQLSSVVELHEGQLDGIVNEGGSNFSVGQRQLFCLARALLRSNTILILDEATANVDLETDSIIQQVIRKEFIDCTILTIAHRLDTVMDSDKIMVLRYGDLIEFDDPHILLTQPSSYLSKLVDNTGPVAAERLRNMALDAYNKKEQC